MHLYTLDLRGEVEAIFPSCLLRGQNTRGKVETLLWFRNEPDPMQPFLHKLVSMQTPEGVYSINLHGIDLLAPSATRSLLLMTDGVRQQTAVPILFGGVGREVLLGLQDMHASLHLSSAYWALDEAGKPQIIGLLPDRLQAIVNVLQARGEICAADLVAESSQVRSKQAINRFSVYLQELMVSGLVIRAKHSARSDEKRKRGWTYRYCPVYSLCV